VERTDTGAFSEELRPTGRTHVEEVHERDHMLEQGKSVRRKECQRQCVMNGLQSPSPISLRHSGEGDRDFWSEVQPRKNGGVGGRS